MKLSARVLMPVFLLTLGIPHIADAITVTKADLKGNTIKVEREEARPFNRFLVDGIFGGTVDANGSYKTEITPFFPFFTCIVTVTDLVGEASPVQPVSDNREAGTFSGETAAFLIAQAA